MIRQTLLAVFLGAAVAGQAGAAQHDGEPTRDDPELTQEQREADERMRTWEERMQEIGRQADALSRETRERLDHAWEDTREQWDRLQTASRHQWDKARDRFTDAMGRLERAWEAATEEQQDAHDQ
ncbi:MAG: hypothetical protein JJT90_03800 [Ectothiorhodospiraceae bacterium]|nr:hypothetical protein [Ectothiorhodospiraceae bacterium]